MSRTFRNPRYKSYRLLPTQTWVDQLPPAPAPAAVRLPQDAHVATLAGRMFSCAVVQAKVPATRCLELQFSPTCLGCAAASHLCHACRVQPLVFPELELCRRCLLSALAWELERGVVGLERFVCVSCRRVRRSIPVEDCRELQRRGTAECRGCDQVSRRCERCRRMPVCYPEDGWCRSCAVESYGGAVGTALLAKVRTVQQRRVILARAPWSPAAAPSVARLPRPEPPAATAGTEVTALALRVGRGLVAAFQAGEAVSLCVQRVQERFRITRRQALAVKRLLVEWGVVRLGAGCGRRIFVPTVEQFDALASGTAPAVSADVAGAPRAPADGAALQQLEQALASLGGCGRYPRRVLAQRLIQLASAVAGRGLPLLADLLRQASRRLNWRA